MLDNTEENGFLIDLDGTLISAGRALPGALELLELLRGRFALVSNDAEHTPRQLSKLLADIGLSVRPEQIILAGTSAIQSVARESSGCRVMILGSMALERHAEGLGLEVVRERPDVVLVARDRTFSYPRLASAANAVLRGAALVVANPDLVHPGPGGSVVPETGALLSSILACTGPVPHRIVGKPEPELFECALRFLGIPAHRALMVGDNPATDGAGAARLGISFLSAKNGLQVILKDLAEWRDASSARVRQRL